MLEWYQRGVLVRFQTRCVGICRVHLGDGGNALLSKAEDGWMNLAVCFFMGVAWGLMYGGKPVQIFSVCGVGLGVGCVMEVLDLNCMRG